MHMHEHKETLRANAMHGTRAKAASRRAGGPHQRSPSRPHPTHCACPMRRSWLGSAYESSAAALSGCQLPYRVWRVPWCSVWMKPCGVRDTRSRATLPHCWTVAGAEVGRGYGWVCFG